MVRVIWISRHPLNLQNIEILKKAFGENITISQITKTLTPEDVASIIEHNGKNAKYVVVLPPNLIQKFLEQGAEVYRFIVERKLHDDGTVHIEPIGLERILEIKYTTERVV